MPHDIQNSRQRVLGIAVVFSLAALVLVAGTVNKPHNFVDGTAILASQVNENFDILYNLVNGNLTTENISGIDASKITSGTLDAARLPSGSSSGTGSSDRIILFEAQADSSYVKTIEINAKKCIEAKDNLNILGNNVGIFISKSEDRPIKNLIISEAAELPVYGPTNIKISDSWNALWDGNIDVSLKDADVLNSSEDYFTRSKTDGTTDDICTASGYDWNSDGYDEIVTVGKAVAIDSQWIESSYQPNCSGRRPYVYYAY